MTGFIDGVCLVFKVEFVLFYEDLQNGAGAKLVEKVREAGADNGLCLRHFDQ